jgi:hypothetical protein
MWTENKNAAEVSSIMKMDRKYNTDTNTQSQTYTSKIKKHGKVSDLGYLICNNDRNKKCMRK